MIVDAPVLNRDAVLSALATVRDPELDEDIVSLGFVADVAIADDGLVEVRLRLPTFFCAANFAFLMSADAHAAITTGLGVRARIILDGHYASDEINDGLADGNDFDASFVAEADGSGLEGLCALFRNKAFLAHQQRLCETLLADNRSAEQLAGFSIADLPDCAQARLYLDRRAELGLGTRPQAPFVVTPAGDPVGPGRIEQQLRIGRAVRVSIDGNAGFCRGLLETATATRGDPHEENRIRSSAGGGILKGEPAGSPLEDIALIESLSHYRLTEHLGSLCQGDWPRTRSRKRTETTSSIRRFGSVADAVVEALLRADVELTTTEVHRAVEDLLGGQVAASSVKNSLARRCHRPDSTFERVGHGRYRARSDRPWG